MSEHDELHQWARGAFKPATMHGNMHAMRARAISRSNTHLSATDVIVGLLAVGGGYFIGRYWKRTHGVTQSVHGDTESSYVIGARTLAAR